MLSKPRTSVKRIKLICHNKLVLMATTQATALFHLPAQKDVRSMKEVTPRWRLFESGPLLLERSLYDEIPPLLHRTRWRGNGLQFSQCFPAGRQGRGPQAGLERHASAQAGY